ncbi:MAG: bifunctional phosphopantothenoylcysteine decarboxylase/phosphopantothenate synthase [Bacteroidota bacterium]
MLQGKKILLGISASIAAYKACTLIRLLKKQGAEVQVIISPAAADFVTPLTLATLSERPCLQSFVRDAEGSWNNHVDLGLWADAFIIAPATANTISACAKGSCSNLLQAVYLSARCPVFLAPAMDLDMWAHPAVKTNISTLRSYGNYILEPGTGHLASGLSGEGRLMEPEEILEYLSAFFSLGGTAVSGHKTQPDLAIALGKDIDLHSGAVLADAAVNYSYLPLTGQQVLITAGPTQEAIDPVRYIGNHSSGKMGYALAAHARSLGADVVLISGPTDLPDPEGILVHRVTSAAQMLEAVKKYPEYNLAVLAAAVADYRPAEAATQKIKKKDNELILTLVKTADIAATLGKSKTSSQVLVGFALETENELDNALGKLERKNFDLIVLNSMRDAGAGFRTDTNKVTLLGRNNIRHEIQLKPKNQVAAEILDFICSFILLKPADSPLSDSAQS